MNADAKDKETESFAGTRGRHGRQDQERDRVVSSSSSGGRRRKRKAKKDGGEQIDQHANDNEEDDERKMPPPNNDNANSNANESDGDETLQPSLPLSQSERKLRRERRRRNDLHQSFRRLINTLSRCHPEVSRRPATDDDVNSAEGSRPGLRESVSERLARAAESGGAARDLLAAATDTTKLNRIDIIECTVESIEKLLADKEASSAKMAQMSEQLEKKDQEIATLRMRLQQSQLLSVGSHGRAATGAGVTADAAEPGPNRIVSGTAAVHSHPLPSLQMRLQESAATAQQVINLHNQAASRTRMVNNASVPRPNHGHAIANNTALPAAGSVNNMALLATGHATNSRALLSTGHMNNTVLPAVGHANSTALSAGSFLLVPPATGSAVRDAQLVVNPAMPGVGTLVVNPPAVANPAANIPAINRALASFSAPLGNSNNADANAVLAAASLIAEASQNSNSNSSNTSVALGQFFQNGSHQGSSAGTAPPGAPFM